MKHFDIWRWADFVRGVGDGADRSEMETHLSSGCPPCRNIAAMLSNVAAAARGDAQYEPPDYAIRYAKAIYSHAHPERVGLRRLLARLVHDSVLEPLPAGLRGQDRLSRRALYEAEGYHLDLQLERQPASGVITLVGQLADRLQPSSSTEDVPVWLMVRESLVASTVCNHFGEFQLEYEPRRNLRLFVPLREAGKRLEISLNRLTPGGAHRPRSAVLARKAHRRKSGAGPSN
jgi:hypothetical protein